MDPLILAIVGGVLVFGLIVAMLLVFAGGPSVSERLAETATATSQEVIHRDRAVATGRSDPIPGLSDALRGTAFWDNMQMQLLRAGLLLRPSEALIICVVSMFAGLIIGWLVTGQLILGILEPADTRTELIHQSRTAVGCRKLVRKNTQRRQLVFSDIVPEHCHKSAALVFGNERQ